jgi:GMP synthase-like glutamine amidotransferase
LRLAILEHDVDAPAGLIAEWALERGHEIDVMHVPALQRWPDPGEHDAIVALGSERSVHASVDGWIAAEIAYLRAATRHDVPVLGVCFGGQALAAALGAVVSRAPRKEIGWLALTVEGDFPAGPWFAWHSDGFSLPAGATPLACTEVGLQAFRLGRAVGLQFHPEVTPAIVDGWLRTGHDDLHVAGVEAEAIGAGTRATADAARRRAFSLFDRVAGEWWALAGAQSPGATPAAAA